MKGGIVRLARAVGTVALLAGAWSAAAAPAPAAAQAPPTGRAAVEALVFPPLVFDPPRPEEHEVEGVPVFHLRDDALPLVDVHLQIRGGSGHFPRERMASFAALPALLRSGGTLRLPPDSVEARIERLALEVAFVSGGGGMAASLNALVPDLPEGLRLFREILLEPRFDAEAVETWRGQELDRVLRREDDPGTLAISLFNHLLFGDHPTGWIPDAGDYAPERVTPARLREAHGTVFCRENLILGIAGALDWREAEALAREFLAPWPACATRPTEPPPAELRRERAVFVLPRRVEASTIVVAGPGGILQDDSPDYFASRIADHVLGNSGLGSRLLQRLRTEEGLAYSAYSLWTAGPRTEGIAGAVAISGAERTVEAARALVETMERMRTEPPSAEEVAAARSEIENGYVFAFPSASTVVGRRIGYRAAGLEADWLERYLDGIRAVTPEAVARVVRERLAVEAMTILVVGDPERFDPGLEALGPVYLLRTDGSYEPWATAGRDLPGAASASPTPAAPGGSR